MCSHDERERKRVSSRRTLEVAAENKIDITRLRRSRARREKAFRNKWLFKFHRCTQFLYQLSSLVLRNWISRRAFIVCDIQERDFYVACFDKFEIKDLHVLYCSGLFCTRITDKLILDILRSWRVRIYRYAVSLPFVTWFKCHACSFCLSGAHSFIFAMQLLYWSFGWSHSSSY